MNEDGVLFGGFDPTPPRPTIPEGEALPRWQMDRLRQRLDALGLVTMAERQALIEKLAGRSVASLHQLTFSEARAIDERLSTRSSGASEGSTWDNRDQDTWIDRL